MKAAEERALLLRIRDLERELETMRQRLNEQGRILSAVCAEGHTLEIREYERERAN